MTSISDNCSRSLKSEGPLTRPEYVCVFSHLDQRAGLSAIQATTFFSNIHKFLSVNFYVLIVERSCNGRPLLVLRLDLQDFFVSNFQLPIEKNPLKSALGYRFGGDGRERSVIVEISFSDTSNFRFLPGNCLVL